MAAFTGKILNINLSTGLISEESIPDSVYRQYLGGTGLAAALLYERIPAGADPLGPENILGFLPGLLTGTGALFSGRWMAVGKSPLTGTWGDANCGGFFAQSIKQCGYDGILFYGISPRPVYLFVDNQRAELRDAGHLWGRDAVESEELLRKEVVVKKRVGVACIGQAGEKLSLISGIVHDRGRIAARSGLGAVMGSKKLKAVVLAGSRPVGGVQAGLIKSLNTSCAQALNPNLPQLPGRYLAHAGNIVGKLPVNLNLDGILTTLLFRIWGTAAMNQASLAMGDAPIKNWLGTPHDYPLTSSRALDPDLIIAREEMKYHCYACPLGCGGILSADQFSRDGHKPEYETCSGFGNLLLNTDLDSILEINDLLNRAGMDSISAAATVAFACECYEKGLITQADTGGLDLSWGNSPAFVTLVQQMIAREGFGAVLADGARAAARQVGSGSEEFAMHAGGQELAFHDPRRDPGYGLHASIDPTPGRHHTGAMQYYDLFRLWKKIPGLPAVTPTASHISRYQATRENALKAVATSCFTQLIAAGGFCLFGLFPGVDRVPIFEWFNAATGWDLSPEEYMQVGRRIQTLRQLFNIRQGIDPWSLKTNPRMIGFPPLPAGPNRGRSFDLDQVMSDYWREIGWNADTGVPLQETLEKLGLPGIESAVHAVDDGGVDHAV